MVRKIIGIGAGGHAKVLIDILKQEGIWELVGLTDIRQELHGQKILGIPVIGNDAVLPALLLKEGIRYAFIGVGSIGDTRPRARLFEKVKALGYEMPNIVHRSAVVADSVAMGEGVCVFAGALINPDVIIGNNVTIYTGTVIEHDCVIGDHVQLSPGVRVAGGVKVGKGSFIGVGASVIQNIAIGSNAIIGAGSVVIRDVPDNVVVVGVPARILKRVEG